MPCAPGASTAAHAGRPRSQQRAEPANRECPGKTGRSARQEHLARDHVTARLSGATSVHDPVELGGADLAVLLIELLAPGSRGLEPLKSRVELELGDLPAGSDDCWDGLSLLDLCGRMPWPLEEFIRPYVVVTGLRSPVGSAIEIFRPREVVMVDAWRVREVGNPSGTRQRDGMLAELEARYHTLTIAMSLLDPLAGLSEFIGKHAPVLDYHAVGITFVMAYVMIMPLGVSHLLCLLFGAVSYVLLLPQDRGVAAKKPGLAEKGTPAVVPAAKDTATPLQEFLQQQPVDTRSRTAASASSTPLAQAAPWAELAPPPRPAAQQKWRAPAAAGADRAAADDDWRSRHAAAPPWRQRAPQAPGGKVALSSGLSAARRALAKAA
ncbi:unnamed protein product [Prorocentrum cordatum]|uniref:Uncharacterized protein n=1 Tax=Prorocentrum cordatum TaxID=2364126 RepID=A0ABN9TAP4_9DINO|nr:unnamed protein product [Polarella glacialis]